MFIVDLDELNFGELFEVLHERKRNRVKRAIRLATPRKVNVGNTIGKCQFAIASESVEHKRKPLITFDIPRTFEVFIENGADQIL